MVIVYTPNKGFEDKGFELFDSKFGNNGVRREEFGSISEYFAAASNLLNPSLSYIPVSKNRLYIARPAGDNMGPPEPLVELILSENPFAMKARSLKEGNILNYKQEKELRRFS